MKLGSFPALAAVLFMSHQTAQATIAIFSGTQSERYGHYTTGQGSMSNGTRFYSSRIFFIYELETGRSIEVRVLKLNYEVRKERNLVRVNTPREGSTAGPATSDTILSTGERKDLTQGAQVSLITWEGAKAWSVLGPEKDATTGLPVTFPKTMSARQNFSGFSNVEDAAGFHLRRTGLFSILAPMTNASNLAGENFDAALQRLKNALNGQGKTEQEPLLNGID